MPKMYSAFREVWFGVLILLCIAVNVAENATTPVDCHPDINADEASCTARGCIWQDPGVPGAPACTFPSGYGYQLSGDPLKTDWGYMLYLQRKQTQPSPFGNDVDNVYLDVVILNENILRLKFYDPNNPRFVPPVPIDTPIKQDEHLNYDVAFITDPQFGVTVTRSSTQATIFDTTTPGFIFSDQFLHITTKLSSPYVYGLGQQRHTTYAHDMNWKTWTMFARDHPSDSDLNIYGSQPFYMNVEADGSANGVLLLNSNAMEVTLQPEPALTYRTIGGILDFYIFLGPTPEDVVMQYTSLIGRPLTPPYWNLGFQLCKYGYKDTAEIRSVVQRMRDANIPQDVQWTDIDYMDSYKDFTLSTSAFADLPDLIGDIHDHGQKFIVIIDAGIAEDPDDFAYQEGIKEDIFIKYANGTILHAKVWPGPAVFPDFTHENALRYWTHMFAHLYDDLNVQYDGIWTDMNEPSNFVDGSMTGCTANNLNYPPYPTHMRGADTDGKIFEQTICMDTEQRGGSHYNLHNLFGYLQSRNTHSALTLLFPERRPVIVTRSQFTGSGRYASNWLGDNASTWQAIKDAIVGILEYNIFGMPFAGADICGFLGNTTVELCTRWMQVGAFYPFSRNHNNNASPDQDPPSLGSEVVNASIRALTQRYRLLPYLYTLLQKSHDYGSTVARPLLHEFSEDANTWNISTQFMWGTALMISPVLDEGAVQVNAYIPDIGDNRWYDYYTGVEVETKGETVTLDAPLDGNIPLHLAGGNIIPTQEPGLTTYLSRQNPMGLLVTLASDYTATGSLYWDDGVTPDTRTLGLYNEFQFDLEQNVLQILVVNDGLGDMRFPLDTIVFYGFPNAPASIDVDFQPLDMSHVSYDTDTKVLTLTELGLALPQYHQIKITDQK